VTIQGSSFVHIQYIDSNCLSLLRSSSHSKIKPVAIASRVCIWSKVHVKIVLSCLYNNI